MATPPGATSQPRPGSGETPTKSSANGERSWLSARAIRTHSGRLGSRFETRGSSADEPRDELLQEGQAKKRNASQKHQRERYTERAWAS
jgi:hypothetical protein